MIIRPYDESDEGFVYKAWLHGFKSSNFSGPYAEDVLFSATRETVDRLRMRPGVRIAVAIDDRGKNSGFVAWEKPGQHLHYDVEADKEYTCNAPVLLWAYVKEPLRRMGVAKALLKHAEIEPVRDFCFAFMPSGPGRAVLEQKWTGGSWDVKTYRSRLPKPKGTP